MTAWPFREIEETNERVAGTEPYLVTRFRWRAERRARHMNDQRLEAFPSYRLEVQRIGGRWAVVAMQNRRVDSTARCA